jgi:hypothetical protein
MLITNNLQFRLPPPPKYGQDHFPSVHCPLATEAASASAEVTPRQDARTIRPPLSQTNFNCPSKKATLPRCFPPRPAAARPAFTHSPIHSFTHSDFTRCFPPPPKYGQDHVPSGHWPLATGVGCALDPPEPPRQLQTSPTAAVNEKVQIARTPACHTVGYLLTTDVTPTALVIYRNGVVWSRPPINRTGKMTAAAKMQASAFLGIFLVA